MFIADLTLTHCPQLHFRLTQFQVSILLLSTFWPLNTRKKMNKNRVSKQYFQSLKILKLNRSKRFVYLNIAASTNIPYHTHCSVFVFLFNFSFPGKDQSCNNTQPKREWKHIIRVFLILCTMPMIKFISLTWYLVQNTW